MITTIKNPMGSETITAWESSETLYQHLLKVSIGTGGYIRITLPTEEVVDLHFICNDNYGPEFTDVNLSGEFQQMVIDSCGFDTAELLCGEYFVHHTFGDGLNP
jgi:hypothetical protein